MYFIPKETRQRGFEGVGKGRIAWKPQSWLSVWLASPFFVNIALWHLNGHRFHWSERKVKQSRSDSLRIAVVKRVRSSATWTSLTGGWPGLGGRERSGAHWAPNEGGAGNDQAKVSGGPRAEEVAQDSIQGGAAAGRTWRRERLSLRAAGLGRPPGAADTETGLPSAVAGGRCGSGRAEVAGNYAL